MDVSTKSSDNDVDDKDIILAVDNTGVKVTNRGQWMHDKWDLEKKKRKRKKGASLHDSKYI